MAKSEHGALSRYNRDKCRCDLCREAHVEYARQRREEFRRNPPPDAPAHGTRSRYVLGCLCEDCREAHRNWVFDYERRKKARAKR